jgi:hypothetical protein
MTKNDPFDRRLTTIEREVGAGDVVSMRPKHTVHGPCIAKDGLTNPTLPPIAGRLTKA